MGKIGLTKKNVEFAILCHFHIYNKTYEKEVSVATDTGCVKSID